MKTFIRRCWLLMAIGLLAGCASVASNNAAVGSAPKELTATGYGRFDDSGRLQVKQRWLSTQQIAKLNAFRGLADQLYYESVGEGKTVGLQVINDERYRVYLDSYLRDAKATDYQTVNDRLKTTLTLKLTPRFYQCMGGDAAKINQCLREDGKSEFTRLGYKPALVVTPNLACGTRDCSDQFDVQGFSKDRNRVDDVLLDFGMYDLQWTVNTGGRALFNFMLIDTFLNEFYYPFPQ